MAAPNKKKVTKANLERIAMRVPASIKRKYERAASLQGETFSGWAKTVLAEAADRQIREHEFLDMAMRDRLAFAKAILEPPAPAKSAVEAAKRYKKVFGL
jgi:uncharacterized protein (DUF1778 family)